MLIIRPEELRNLTEAERRELLTREAGGKARNMASMTLLGVPVPEWFSVSASSFRLFITHNRLDQLLKLPFDLQTDVRSVNFEAIATEIEAQFLKGEVPGEVVGAIQSELQRLGWQDQSVAVRSSGLDEDSAENSFAGQFSSYLFQKGEAQILQSLKRCWASGFSARALAYRVERGISLDSIAVGVVIQKMVEARVSGVAFSRNPVRALDRDSVLVSSVFGLGEGLVSGYLESDNFDVSRNSLKAASLMYKSELAEKSEAFRRNDAGGLVKASVAADLAKAPSLTETEVRSVAQLVVDLEERLGSPQDCEWAIDAQKIYCVQTRPVTSLPPDVYFQMDVRGQEPTLWDNSNIIESYSGVTTPLTFSFASRAYRQVYIQFCDVMGVPPAWIVEREDVFRNMLGLIRGRIYYNLVNWYKLVLLLPGSASNKSFMETMMGTKQGLKPEVAKLFEFVQHPPRYSPLQKLILMVKTVGRFLQIDSMISEFNRNFVPTYETARHKNYRALPLDQLLREYNHLETAFLSRWQVPIINDYLCMIFFGLLKSLTEKWVAGGDPAQSQAVQALQNDLLCGQGDLESTEPTKTLMRIAADIDKTRDDAFKKWFVSDKPDLVWKEIKAGRDPKVKAAFESFLDKYGFRCINELKLEESDLHDDPAFVVGSVQSYIRTKAYDIEAMEKREKEIRAKAEEELRRRLGGWKLGFYNWILHQTRRAVRNRENLRFARTKVFGVARHLIRAMGFRLQQLGVLEAERDVFYLTIEELIAYNEGRSVTASLGELAKMRKAEFQAYDRSLPPPDRFLLEGSVGVSLPYAQVLAELDLLAKDRPKSDDPNVLIGTPCCPGVVEGVVRVVRDMKDAEGIDGEILVTERTDPGWVPLYPSCSGLLIERGSLLSHSAVVARELGLPTIVGISGGLMKKLKTGDRVRLDGARGEMRILEKSP